MCNFSLKGLLCVLSAITGDIILLPATLAERIVSQPDEVLSVKLAHIDDLQADDDFSQPAVVHRPRH
ncbi:hypothetical protein GJ744_001808 [Endocarpon pusillum]|uniref:Uncharacterized protein n=1 Tax=Endocarpon pusillum TaxID=364733 RepID=A0A8H7AC21_9EURO|nr:hypothetical protein GJ744_001808 [Endocarpon pusillum]